MRRTAVIQSNYIPWKGYFDIINDVDLFIFYDDVQYTKNDWRNRNKIKTPNGASWLTIPVGKRESRLICEVELPASGWAEKHWQTIKQFYGKAPHFSRYKAFVREMFLGRHWTYLAEFNQFVIQVISHELLGINVEFHDSRDYQLSGAKQERLLQLLTKAETDVYISGPAAQAYLDVDHFAAAGITTIFKDYAGYPQYHQFHPPFEHSVTVLDLLFHCGPEAPYYIWGWRNASQACHSVGQALKFRR